MSFLRGSQQRPGPLPGAVGRHVWGSKSAIFTHTIPRRPRIRKAHGFSFWDSAIVAAALALGCDRVYTEDLTHGQVVDGLAIIDPFR